MRILEIPGPGLGNPFWAKEKADLSLFIRFLRIVLSGVEIVKRGRKGEEKA